jgi:phenylalanyl-tRNA synthetase alpha chain
LAGISHWIEQKIILGMKGAGGLSVHDIAGRAGLDADQARRGIQWLLEKGAIRADTPPRRTIHLGEAGAKAATEGLPERRLLDMLNDGMDAERIYGVLGREMGPAVGVCVRNGWLRMEGRRPTLLERPDVIPGERALEALGRGDAPSDSDVRYFERRPGYIQERTEPPTYILVDLGADHVVGGFNVEADVAEAYIARTHPLFDTISEVREAFVSLGFDEVTGDMVQSSFWNFDALFTPQDHPAREMQDTFYMEDVQVETGAPHHMVESVAEAHRKGWGGDWDAARAAEPVLRTHTTCVTIRHLAENDPAEARAFSLGRVFRNEKPSYKHLVEFHQVEGVVVGDGVSLRDLMGMQREFYRRMGMEKVKFWPTYFPYTEPSLQSMVYNETLGKWVELFGMGMFRPEVTKPLGISRPVLAWGGGIERMAMLRYGIDDVRTLYGNDIGWLRGLPLCP